MARKHLVAEKHLNRVFPAQHRKTTQLSRAQMFSLHTPPMDEDDAARTQLEQDLAALQTAASRARTIARPSQRAASAIPPLKSVPGTIHNHPIENSRDNSAECPFPACGHGQTVSRRLALARVLLMACRRGGCVHQLKAVSVKQDDPVASMSARTMV